MKIVIDIDDEDYKRIQDIPDVFNSLTSRTYSAIKNGTQLPKGHGRLIDADEAIKTLKSLGNRDYRREKGTIQEAEKMLSFDEYTSTIIGADTESEGV